MNVSVLTESVQKIIDALPFLGSKDLKASLEDIQAKLHYERTAKWFFTNIHRFFQRLLVHMSYLFLSYRFLKPEIPHSV